MCRIAGFLGSAPVALSSVVTTPAHSLRAQARAPRELPAGMLGSDGYGLGWFTSEAREPARYRSTLPVWSDPNLDTMAPFLRASCFVASTRTAQDNMPVALTNTPPFCFANTLLVHNGSATNFHETLVEPLRARLRVETRRLIQGNTDSECLAALLADTSGPTLEARVRALIKLLRTLVHEANTSAQLNVLACDGDQLVATRYAVGASAPSLYFAEQSGQAVVVASEPLDDERVWVRLPESALLVAARSNKHGITVTESAL